MRGPDLVALVASACLLLASFVAIGVGSPALGTPTYFLLVGAAAAGYVAAMAVALAARPRPTRPWIVGCVLLAVAVRVPLWMTGTGTDTYRYVWDARVTRAGYNPYIVRPSDSRLAWLHTDETQRIDHPDLPTPYPPGAQLFFRVVYLFSARAYAFKVALAVCEALLGLVLWRWLVRRQASTAWILAYAWNPLVILVTAGEAHLDVAGALCVMASATFLLAGRRLLSTLCFVLAVAIKPLPLVLLPLYWRRVRVFDAAVGVLVFGLLCLPYVQAWHMPIGSLGAFIDRFRFNDPVFAATGAVLAPRVAAALAVVAGLAVACLWRARRGIATPGTWAWPMAVALAASPVVYPWYLVWLLPFATTVETLPLLAWSVSILATYRVWRLVEQGATWKVPGGILVFEFGTVVAVAAAVWLHRRRAGHASQ